MAESFSSSSCMVKRPRRVPAASALLSASVGVSALLFSASVAPSHLGIGGLVGLMGLGAALVITSRSYVRAWQSGELTVTRDGIRMDGREVVPAGLLAVARLSRLPGAKPRVQCFSWRGFLLIEIKVLNEEQGEALIAATQAGAAHGVSSVRLPHHLLERLTLSFSRWLAWALLLGAPLMFAVTLVVGVRSVSASLLLMSFAAPTLSLLGVFLFLHAPLTWLRIGPGGMVVRSLGFSRFVSYADVVAVDRWPARPFRPEGPCAKAVSTGFDLVLRSGRRVALVTLNERLADDNVDEDFVALAVERAMANAKGRSRTEAPLGSGSQERKVASATSRIA